MVEAFFCRGYIGETGDSVRLHQARSHLQRESSGYREKR